MTVNRATYTDLREHLAAYLDRIVEDREVVIVRRSRGQDVALLSAAELKGLVETAHLLRSPRNARRLLSALRRAERWSGEPVIARSEAALDRLTNVGE